jgi:hypothetical protein
MAFIVLRPSLRATLKIRKPFKVIQRKRYRTRKEGDLGAYC